MQFDVTFTCQPFRYLYPAAKSFTVETSGSTFYNPGTAHSLPRVTIAGTGNFAVTIGDVTLTFNGVSGGGIIIDSETMEAYTYDGAALANDHVSGTYWAISPGTNAVTWDAATGSSVTSVTILPRWRYY